MHSRATKASSGSIQTQLGLCAAAIAGTAAVASTAEAVIVTTFQNTTIPIPATLAGVYLNFATGATGTSAFAGWDFNPYQTASGLGFYWGTDLVAGARAGGVETAPGSNLDADYAATGGPVGPAQTFTSAIQGASLNYRNTGLHRLPLRFVNGAVFNYGYVDIQTTAGAGNQAGFPANLRGWVFDDSGAAMTVPPIPEPSSASLLALVAGAAGLRGWRRSRSA
jgi:hypothetical protein